MEVLMSENTITAIGLFSREEFIYSTQIRARAPDSDKTMCIDN